MNEEDNASTKIHNFVHNLFINIPSVDEPKLECLSKIVDLPEDQIDSIIRRAQGDKVPRRTYSKSNKYERDCSGRTSSKSNKYERDCSGRTSSKSNKYERDCFAEGVIRRCVIRHHQRLSAYPTLLELQEAFKQYTFKSLKTIHQSKLANVLHRIGLEKTSERCYTDKYESDRNQFIDAMSEARSAGRHIVYVDETIINSGIFQYRQTEIDEMGILSNYQKQIHQIILLHAGTLNGFLNDALHMELKKRNDMPNLISTKDFRNWVKLKLLPNLPPFCTIVMDNAMYHDESKAGVPNEMWLRNEIEDWLLNRQVQVELVQTWDISKLLALVDMNKNVEPSETVQMLVEAQGHQLVWLPPQHQELNPFELIWRDVKSYVHNNKHRNLNELQAILNYVFNNYGANKWRKCVDYVETIEKLYVQLQVPETVLIEE